MSEILYNITLYIVRLMENTLLRMRPIKSKTRRFAKLQRGALIMAESLQLPEGKPVVWAHASSLGEWNILRPVVAELRKRMDCAVVLTFFSPTGYDALHSGCKEVNAVLPLPLDRTSNVHRFLNAISPAKAIFAASEIWPHYLKELKRRGVPTAMISCQARPGSSFCRWYGRLMLRALRSVSLITTLTTSSRDLLTQLGCQNVVLTADPLFDAAIATRKRPYENAIVENFCGDHKVLVAGSIHLDNDLRLVAALANTHKDLRLLIVPHEIGRDALSAIGGEINGTLKYYSHCDESTDFSGVQVLVIDFVGALSRLYRYGQWAYVGGGFTRYQHNVLEAAVYGMPVAFGPRTERAPQADVLAEAKVGTQVSTPEEILTWYYNSCDQNALHLAHQRAEALVLTSEGAAGRIAEEICRLAPSTPNP